MLQSHPLAWIYILLAVHHPWCSQCFSLAYCAYILLPSCSLHLLFEQYASTAAHSVNTHCLIGICPIGDRVNTVPRPRPQVIQRKQRREEKRWLERRNVENLAGLRVLFCTCTVFHHRASSCIISLLLPNLLHSSGVCYFLQCGEIWGSLGQFLSGSLFLQGNLHFYSFITGE